MTSGRSLSFFASIAALAIAIDLSMPSTADAHVVGGPCLKITMVSADADYKLHLVNENLARLGLNNRQVGISRVIRAPRSIGILIDHTGDVTWKHKHLGNGEIGFEDHVDDDFNDAVIRVEPVSCPSHISDPVPTPKPTATALEVSFNEATQSVNEGNSVTVTVNVSPDADRSLVIPISVTGGTADSDDYSVSGLTGGKLSLASGEGSASFTIETVEDSDSGAETLDLSFGNLPDGVSEGTQSTAQVTIEDPVAKLKVSFDEATYSVNEGSSVTVTVNVSPNADRSVDLPVSIRSNDAESGDYEASGLTEGKLSFTKGDFSASFTIATVDDSDRDAETLDLSFGELPESVSEGTQGTAQVNINDTTPAPIPNTRGRSVGGVGGGFGIPVQQGNQPPVFTEGVNAVRSVPENAEIPTDVGGPVTATDLDRDTLTYTLGGPDAASFSLDSGTGQLETAIELDYETKASYFVIVYAHDARGGRATIVVAVRVIDVAENEVVFDAPVPAPEQQPVATATPEPTAMPTPAPTATPTPAPTATPTPAPTAAPVPTPTVFLRWPWQSQVLDSTPGPSATAMPTSTPELRNQDQRKNPRPSRRTPETRSPQCSHSSKAEGLWLTSSPRMLNPRRLRCLRKTAICESGP